MGKKLVIIAFLLTSVLAVVVYLTHERKSLRENLEKKDSREPRLVVEDFTFYRYEGSALKSRLSARLGHFYEPNVLELDGEIKGERLLNGERQTVNAESATGYFKAATLTKMMSDTELDRAELTGFVEVGVKDHLLSTDYAEYLTTGSLVRSLRPVRVEGPGRVFTGDDGFNYNLQSEALEMLGQVRGMFVPDKTKMSSNGAKK